MSRERLSSPQAKEIVEKIKVDDDGNRYHYKTYKLGKYLGKGGFAKVYELTDNETKELFAVKIVNK
jgi:serine/threonine protein kinase